MTVAIFTDPRAFLEVAKPLLVADPISTNVITVVTERLTVDDPDADSLWATASDPAGDVCGAAMLNKPWNLFLARMPTDAAVAVAERLSVDTIDLPGVTGERGATEAFAAYWADRHGLVATTLVDERAHRLSTLTAPVEVPGAARPATHRDTAQIVAWLRAFHDEAIPQDPAEDPLAGATRMIERGEVWLWEHDGRTVSMVACRRPEAGTARIGPVYTPPKERGHGYAGGATAAAASGALADGATHVMLYTDLSNPTSNALYARLAFVPDHDAVQIRFDPAA